MASVIGEALIKIRSKLDEAQLRGETGKVKRILGGVAAGFAIHEVGKVLKESVHDAIEAQHAQEKLAFAFEKFPKLADISQKSLEDYNLTLQKHTKFSDESLGIGEATLAQFNLTGTQIKKLIPIVADFAAKTGRDIPEAAQLVGRALLGNTRVLKTIGIDLTKATKSHFDLSKAQAEVAKATQSLSFLEDQQAPKKKHTLADEQHLIIAKQKLKAAQDNLTAGLRTGGAAVSTYDRVLGALKDKVGGFAEKEGKSMAGRLAIMNNQFKEAREKVGVALLPVLTKLANIVISITEAFNNLSPGIKQVIGFVAAGLVTFIALGKVMALLRGATAAFGIASSVAAGGVAAEGAAATAAAPALLATVAPLLAAAAAGAALGVAAKQLIHSGGFSFLGAPSDASIRRLDDYSNAAAGLNTHMRKLHDDGGPAGVFALKSLREEIIKASNSRNADQIIAINIKLGRSYRDAAAAIQAAVSAFANSSAIQAFRLGERTLTDPKPLPPKPVPGTGTHKGQFETVNLTVNQVRDDPVSTAYAIAARLGQLATR